MSPEVFGIAERAMASITFFRAHHASTQPFQVHFQQVLQMLRETARNVYANKPTGEMNFLLAFADALAIANKPGEYVPIDQR